MSTISKMFKSTFLFPKSRVILCRAYCKAPEMTGGGGCRKGLVLGAYTVEEKDGEKDGGENKLTKTAERFNERVGGRLVEMLKEAGPVRKGKVHVFNNIDPEFWSIALCGIGKADRGYDDVETLDIGMEQVRVAAAAGATRLRKEGIYSIFLEDMDHAEQVAEGATLSNWRFQENMLKANWRVVPTIELFESQDMDSWTRGIFKAEAQNLARKLCDMPANQLTPNAFAQAAVDALCPCGVNVEVRDKDWIEEQNMQCLLLCSRGSCEPPVFLELSYNGGGEDKPCLLIGSGITFDAGGLCLKKNRNMGRYRAGMAGAAVVVAAMRAVAALSMTINVTGIIPLYENMPSGLAMKPGDVVAALDGTTITIQDTDNDCRVTLADCLVYGTKKYKPKCIVDLACMTTGVRDALGAGATGVFSNNLSLWRHMKKAGAITGDRVWRLPLWHFYRKELTEPRSVDITNRGAHHGDSSVAAAMLHMFVPCTDWVHMDITGVAFPTKTPNLPYLRIGRMTGRPTRTVIQFLDQLACGEDDGSGSGNGDGAKAKAKAN